MPVAITVGSYTCAVDVIAFGEIVAAPGVIVGSCTCAALLIVSGVKERAPGTIDGA